MEFKATAWVPDDDPRREAVALRTQALNLVMDESTPALAADVRGAVERLMFSGNNAYADEFGKRMAGSIIASLHAASRLDADVVVGATRTAGVSPRGVHSLRKLTDRIEEDR